MRLNRAAIIHLLALVVFSAAVFLPMMGRGFILDDFGHAFVAGQESVHFGLTHPSGGPYYAPLAYGSFKIDWILWGARPFPWAITNLLVHVGNTVLLYFLALGLWRSYVAAWWTAFGFALLFPANVAGIMWIATRAHLIAAFFYLAAMIAALWFIRTKQLKSRAAIAVVAFAALSMFSKESGVTVAAAIAAVIFYESRSRARRVLSAGPIGLFIALFVVLLLYFALRSRSGAIPINFSGISGNTIGYVLSVGVLCENLLFYGSRTYGLLLFVALSIFLHLRGLRPHLASLTKHDIFLSLMLFAVAIAPCVLLPQTPGIYSYLPGIGAALLLGAVARSLYETVAKVHGTLHPLTLAPIIVVVLVYIALTVVYSCKWIQLAEVNTAVMRQILAQQPRLSPNTFVVLTYSEIDHTNRFPQGFGDWCFPWALRVLYTDRTLDGKIIRQGESYSIGNKFSEVRFSYIRSGTPTVVKTGESVPHS